MKIENYSELKIIGYVIFSPNVIFLVALLVTLFGDWDNFTGRFPANLEKSCNCLVFLKLLSELFCFIKKKKLIGMLCSK